MNKDLYNKIYTVPQNILNNLRKYSGNEIIDNILSRKTVTYQNLKKIKHKMENGETEQLGGNQFLTWVNQSLNSDRSSIDLTKRNKMETGMENAYLQSHEKNNINDLNRPTKQHSSEISGLKVVESLQRINEIILKT